MRQQKEREGREERKYNAVRVTEVCCRSILTCAQSPPLHAHNYLFNAPVSLTRFVKILP